jgi:signal transduction histidine kinase
VDATPGGTGGDARRGGGAGDRSGPEVATGDGARAGATGPGAAAPVTLAGEEQGREEQGREAQVREERLDAARRLAAAVAHDVNNALNPILAAAFLLERRADDPAAVRELARRIARAADGCAANLARLGRFARQGPAARRPRRPVRLAALAAAVIDEARGGWPDGVSVQTALAPARPRAAPPATCARRSTTWCATRWPRCPAADG